MSTKKEFKEIIEPIVLKLIRHPKTNLLEKDNRTSVSIFKISTLFTNSNTFFQKYTPIHHLYSRGTYNTVNVALKKTNADPNEEIGITEVWQLFYSNLNYSFYL